MAQFPIYRPRRLRQNETIRGLVQETRFSVQQLIYPMFVCPGREVADEIAAMPGVYRYSVDRLEDEVQKVMDLGIGSILLFGTLEPKDHKASAACDHQGIVTLAIRALKQRFPSLYIITDVCLCAYMEHGHCGVEEEGLILNDPSLEILAKMALAHAEAGADMVAPSDMMDGRVGAIRAELDAHGYQHIPIMSYSVKYASGFYGPFREAADSAPSFGDRRTYQMNPANREEALREAEQDLAEGADVLMVKPALAYLDVIQSVKNRFPYPLAAYNVSGEYAMVKAAAQAGWIEEKRVVLEMIQSMFRAGADMVITYFAKDLAGYLKE